MNRIVDWLIAFTVSVSGTIRNNDVGPTKLNSAFK